MSQTPPQRPLSPLALPQTKQTRLSPKAYQAIHGKIYSDDPYVRARIATIEDIRELCELSGHKAEVQAVDDDQYQAEVELGGITLHFAYNRWDEVLDCLRDLEKE